MKVPLHLSHSFTIDKETGDQTESGPSSGFPRESQPHQRIRARPSPQDRRLLAEILPDDDRLAPDGRVMEVLTEHQCQGWLEGYLLIGRHGFFSCYEAFVHIIDSMFNQHAKWLKVCRHTRGAGRSPRSTTC